MPALSPVSKIKLIDGTIVDLAQVNQILIPDNSICNVTWSVTQFSGDVTPITGTSDDYLLSIVIPQETFYPVGSLYATETSTNNPATILGFGTWTKYAPADLNWNDTDLDWNNTVGVTSGIYVWKRTE